jgi:hypothetical protein
MDEVDVRDCRLFEVMGVTASDARALKSIPELYEFAMAYWYGFNSAYHPTQSHHFCASNCALNRLCGFGCVVVCRSRGDLRTMITLNQFAIAAGKRSKAEMEKPQIVIPAMEEWGPAIQ